MTNTEAPTQPASQRYDLRRTDIDDALDRVEKALQVRLDPDGQVRKRRSLGAGTDRGTWIRIELRGPEKLDGQGWGVEASHVLHGVAKPTWHAGFSWLDTARQVMWRADETDLVTDAPIKGGGTLITDPQLSPDWWAVFDRSLDALAAHRTVRRATIDTEPMTQQRLTSTIENVFPGRIDTTIGEWTTAHADLGWANLTSPTCFLLDWEDWGTCPRGTDSAKIWASSLAVPGLADQIHRHRRADLDSRTGRLMALFYCSQIIAVGVDDTSPLLQPAKHEAARLIEHLRDRPRASQAGQSG
ncbi:hypothetical protein [Catenulispora pinisilvae]|uniref:hypothetical protein n=1 Tax=Catenulispora pinisilvae TaxID=2705253 RepID=UPI0018914582|nr:hypothetical protein [Catenulispora pinisilvae]